METAITNERVQEFIAEAKQNPEYIAYINEWNMLARNQQFRELEEGGWVTPVEKEKLLKFNALRD